MRVKCVKILMLVLIVTTEAVRLDIAHTFYSIFLAVILRIFNRYFFDKSIDVIIMINKYKYA